MKKLTLDFYGEKIPIPFPNDFPSLSKEIDQNLNLNISDVFRLDISYTKNKIKKSIKSEDDYKLFILSKSSIINLEIVESKELFQNNSMNLIQVSKEEKNSFDFDDNLPKKSSNNSQNTTSANSSLNPNYTFSTFVVGNNNRFAQAAALAVAETPGTMYNPLFIYSGVGLGKTHLMHAIGNEILRSNKDVNVLYVTSEKFTNQVINSIKDSKMEQFRNKYRNSVDVLLIDDIQFIASKERTQEEFFHTFEALHNANKQIVIASDRPPKDIMSLEERLRTRFEWGIMTDISSPDYETRVAILKKKIETEKIIIDDSILSNIATKINTNIRELEGVLNKLVARANLMNSPITMEMSEWAINEIISTNREEKIISSDYIQEEVAKYFNIDKKDLIGNKRSSEIVFPRQIAMYLCRTVAEISFPQIGKDFGNRDHTTVIHSVNKISKELENNTTTKLIVDSIKNILLSNR